MDSGGKLTGRVLQVNRAPDTMLLRVSIDGVGELSAVGPAGGITGAGDQVRLRLDPAATAVIGSRVAQQTGPPRLREVEPDIAGTLVR